jgi:type IV secretory pathway VirB10-like protein
MSTDTLPVPRLKRWVKPATIALAVCVVLGLALLPVLVRQIPVPTWGQGGQEETPSQPAILPDAYREPTTTYGARPHQAAEPAAPTQATTLLPGLLPPPPTVVPQASTPTTRTESTAQIPTAVLQPSPGLPGAALPGGFATQPLQQHPLTQAIGQGTGPKRWGIDLTHAQQQARQPTPKEREEAGRSEEAKKLIKPAVWAVPAFPQKTLYRQQAIPCVTVDEMVSDIPGQYKCRVSVPVFDRFQREIELIPKDSIVIITQKRVPGYGDKRLELAVEEIQPPTPEVISLKAAVSDKEGGAGVGGTVNNHIPQLVLATVISTAINIGGRLAAGNPQGYQYSTGQELVRDAGQQVSQDAKGVVDRTLRIPPTITVPAHTPVSVSLMENVTFSRKPLVVR